MGFGTVIVVGVSAALGYALWGRSSPNEIDEDFVIIDVDEDANPHPHPQPNVERGVRPVGCWNGIQRCTCGHLVGSGVHRDQDCQFNRDRPYPLRCHRCGTLMSLGYHWRECQWQSNPVIAEL